MARTVYLGEHGRDLVRQPDPALYVVISNIFFAWRGRVPNRS